MRQFCDVTFSPWWTSWAPYMLTPHLERTFRLSNVKQVDIIYFPLLPRPGPPFCQRCVKDSCPFESWVTSWRGVRRELCSLFGEKCPLQYIMAVSSRGGFKRWWLGRTDHVHKFISICRFHWTLTLYANVEGHRYTKRALQFVVLRMVFLEEQSSTTFSLGDSKKFLADVNRFNEAALNALPEEERHDVAIWLTR